MKQSSQLDLDAVQRFQKWVKNLLAGPKKELQKQLTMHKMNRLQTIEERRIAPLLKRVPCLRIH